MIFPFLHGGEGAKSFSYTSPTIVASSLASVQGRLYDARSLAYWGAGETHVDADYLGPAAFYDLLRIAVAASRLGRSSLHLDYRVINERSGQEICIARMVMVQVDLATETSRPWNTAFREALIGYHGQQIMPS